jgi:polygalacturonase
MARKSVGRRSFLERTVRSLAALALSRTGLAQQTRIASARKPTLNVRDFGATGTGLAKDTDAIQQAIDRCGALGGGEVEFPAGTYLSGAVALRSNTTLRLTADATILGSPDFADYPVTQVRWEGRWIPGRSGLIYSIDADRIAIVGPGKIAGNAALGGRPTPQNPLRHPALIECIRCRDVRFEEFSTDYRLMWSIHPTNCENVSIRNLSIRSTGGNGDGLDIDSCKHVRIDGCDIATGDDCIAIKSGRGSEAYELMQTCEDIQITNCRLADSIFACIGIGSETSGGIRNVRIENCQFTHAQTFAIYVKTRVGRGAFIEDISASSLDVSGTMGGFLRCNALTSGLQDESPVTGEEGIPALKNFRFANIRLRDCPVLADMTGIHPQKPLDGFSLTNVNGNCAKGVALANIRNAEVRDIRVTGLTGPLLSVVNVSGSGLEGAASLDPPRAPEPIPAAATPYSLR